MADGEVVERLVVEFDAKIDKILTKLSGLNRAVHGSAKEIEKSYANINLDEALNKVFSSGRMRLLDAGAEKIGVFGKGLEALGPAGLAAGAALAAFGASMELAEKAGEYATELGHLSAKLGVAVEDVQRFDYVWVQSGIGIDKGREALEKLNTAFGQAQAGFLRPQTANAFEALGFGKDPAEVQQNLLKFKDVEALMAELPARFDKIGSAAEKAGIAARLHIENLVPLLHQGEGGYSDLAKAAQNYGVMTEAQVAHAETMNEELLTAKARVHEAAMALGVEFLPALVALQNALLHATSLLKDFWVAVAGSDDPMKNIAKQTDLASRFQMAAAQAKSGVIKFSSDSERQKFIAEMNGKAEAALKDAGRVADGVRAEEAKKKAQDAAQKPTALIPAGGRSSARAGRAAAGAPADTSAGIAEAGDRAILSAQEGELRAREALTASDDERLAIAKQLIDLETTAKIKANEDQVAKGKMSDADALMANMDIQLAGDERKALLERQAALKVQEAKDATAKAQADSVAEQARTLHDAYYTSIRGALEAAVKGGWPGLARYMADKLETNLLDALANGLTNALLGGGGGGGGLFGTLLATMFGVPHFATGTDSAPGGLSLVGENGPELVNLKQGAQVIPNGMLSALGRSAPGAGGGTTLISFDLKGAVMTQDLVDQMTAMANRAQRNATMQGAALGAQAARTLVPQEMARRSGMRLV